MPNNWDRAVSFVLVLCGMAIAASVVKRTFFPSAVNAAQLRRDEIVTDWKDIVSSSRIVGDPNARALLIVFDDFECPFCQRFHATVEATLRQYPRDVALALVHLPIPGHRFAKPAARAAECAAGQGRFMQMTDALFDWQDSLGLISWNRYAIRAGVLDTVRFSSCFSADTAVPLIDAGVAVAEKFGITSTPTVLLNSWKFGRTPTEADLSRAIDSLLGGGTQPPRSPE